MDGVIVHCNECNEPGEGTWRGVSLNLPDSWIYVVEDETFIFCSDNCLVTFYQKKQWRKGRGMVVMTEKEE